jgi:nucleoside-diphosphate-sugar epimerase
VSDSAGRIFVTGGSGVIGQALLAELDPQEVMCLRHASPLPVPVGSQVSGDICEPRMGLDRGAFRELAKRTSCVVHMAAETRWTSDPKKIELTHRAGAQTAMELAALADVSLHYISTAFIPVEGSEPAGAWGLSAPANDLRSGLDAYLSSKAAADRLVASSGIPGTIIRPSYVIGNSASGAIARFQGLYRVVSLALRNLIPALPVHPDSVTDFVPQDVVARAILGVIRADAHSGELWVTAGERALRAGEFLDLALELAERLGLEASRPRLMPPDVIDRLIRPVFIDHLPQTMQQMFDDMLAMTTLLGHAGLLPSSLELIEEHFDTEVLFDPRSALEHSLLYWAEQKGLLAREELR